MSQNNPLERNRRNNQGRRRQQQRKQRKPKSVAQRQQQIEGDLQHARIPRVLGGNIPVPPFQIRRMRYVDPNFVLKSATNPFIIREFKVNDVFDPDPLLGGGSVSGYTELNALYNRNIVVSASMRAELYNIEPSIVVFAFLMFRDAQPSITYTTYADLVSAREVAPSTRSIVLGVVTGNGRGVLRTPKLPMSSIVGNTMEYMGDISYGASASSSPSNVIWGALALYAYTPLSILTTGVSADISIDFTVRWYSGQKALDLDQGERRQRVVDAMYKERTETPGRSTSRK